MSSTPAAPARPAPPGDEPPAPVPRRRGPMGGAHPGVLLVAGCAVLAVASLPLPAALGYDPWAWVVWGRETVRLDLDTTGGPSWKPLPVVVTAPLSLAGGLAPVLWMVVARTAGLLALAGAARVGTRLAGPWAGALAAALLVLTPDTEARFLRLVAEGHSAPLTAALVLWAWDRHLAGHHRTALVLATALALDRPEAWPFLAAYAAWLWWRDPRARPLVVVAAAALPLLWFGADWWGSGQLAHGAEVAQVDAEDSDRLPKALSRAWSSVPLAVWLGAGAAVVVAVRSRNRVVLVAGGAAVAWLGVVVAMSAHLGYAAIGRFHLPAAVVLCVLAAVGVVRVVGLAPAGRWRTLAAVTLAVLGGLALAGRALGVPDQAPAVADRAEAEADLDRAIAEAGGAGAVAGACGPVVTDDPSIPRMAVAWKLDLPLSEVGATGGRVASPSTAVVRTGGRADRAHAADDGATRVTGNEGWTLYTVGCDPGP